MYKQTKLKHVLFVVSHANSLRLDSVLRFVVPSLITCFQHTSEYICCRSLLCDFFTPSVSNIRLNRSGSLAFPGPEPNRHV